jgi:alkylhydroperoxidase/carboxymuconolactone decarboxylase family protein YurZ
MVAGATSDEVVEAMFVAAVFSGGPGLIALSNVLGMLDK